MGAGKTYNEIFGYESVGSLFPSKLRRSRHTKTTFHTYPTQKNNVLDFKKFRGTSLFVLTNWFS